MESSALAHVEVGYLAEVTRRGGRTPYDMVLAVKATVALRQVSSADAPKSIEVRWPEGETPAAMHWRSFEGSLWRPLVAPDGDALDVAGGLERSLAESRKPRPHGHAHFKWPDYPFRVDAKGSNYDNWTPFHALSEDDDTIRVRSSGRDEAVRRAQAKAADDLLLVDGVLHMRSVPPVWAVGRSRINPWEDAGYVRLALPDFPEHVDWLASFTLDRRDDAVAFAERHVAAVNGNPWNQRFNRGRLQEVRLDGAEVEHDDMPFRDTRADDLRIILSAIEGDLRTVEIMRFDRAFRKAFGDLGAAVDALPETVTSPDQFAGADAAVRAVVAASDPEWPHTWPNVSVLAERMRGLSIRYDVDAELAMAADADAFAAPGM